MVMAKRALELVFQVSFCCLYIYHIFISPVALNIFSRSCQLESLDVFLPYLADPSPGISVSICHLLASSLRSSNHRRNVANWMSPSERAFEVKGKRGWEKTETRSHSSGGWIARTIIELIKKGDMKASRHPEVPSSVVY